MGASRIVVLLVAVSTAGSVQGGPVPELFQAMSRFCDVPARLLYAIAEVESGRYHNGAVTPWPWTLNIEGESLYFDTRAQQFEALMTAITHRRSVDIGLMQLNWGYKFEFVESPWLITDPVYNLNVACRIIKAHYDTDRERGWLHAAGLYHREANRPQDVRAREQYRHRVQRAWDKR